MRRYPSKLNRIVYRMYYWLLLNRHSTLLARFCELVGTAHHKKRIKCKFDGEDWIHSWGTEYLVMHVPLMNPIDWAIQNKQLFFNKFVPSPGCTMIDIGAGAGTEIVFLSEAVGLKGQIFAIEPDEQAFRRLNKMVQLNQLDNVKTYKLALSSNDHTVSFNHISDYGVDSFISETEHFSSQKLEAKKLTTFMKQNQIYAVDFIKMNIEGAEVKVLEGLKDEAFLIKNWCISCHDFLGREGTNTHSFVKNWLIASGYEVSGYSGSVGKGADHLSFYLFGGNRSI